MEVVVHMRMIVYHNIIEMHKILHQEQLGLVQEVRVVGHHVARNVIKEIMVELIQVVTDVLVVTDAKARALFSVAMVVQAVIRLVVAVVLVAAVAVVERVIVAEANAVTLLMVVIAVQDVVNVLLTAEMCAKVTRQVCVPLVEPIVREAVLLLKFHALVHLQIRPIRMIKKHK